MEDFIRNFIFLICLTFCVHKLKIAIIIIIILHKRDNGLFLKPAVLNSGATHGEVHFGDVTRIILVIIILLLINRQIRKKKDRHVRNFRFRTAAESFL